MLVWATLAGSQQVTFDFLLGDMSFRLDAFGLGAFFGVFPRNGGKAFERVEAFGVVGSDGGGVAPSADSALPSLTTGSAGPGFPRCWGC